MKHIDIRGLRYQVVVAAMAALLTAACASSGPTAAHGKSDIPTVAPVTQLSARGVESSIETIPWPQVGPGWMLAVWSPVTGHRPGETPAPNQPAPSQPNPNEVTETLYLVNPAGGRYPITTFPPGTSPRLIDWSSDRGHALFDLPKPGSVSANTVISVDLRTGKQSSFARDQGSPIGYARADGTGVLIGESHYRDHPGWLARVDMAGNQELAYGVAEDYSGGALATSDGTQLVLGSASGLAVMSGDGVPGRRLPVPGKLSACSPVRWWTPTVVLARCGDAVRYTSAGQLWRVPVDGTAPTALTAVNSGQGDDPGFAGDAGDTDAWQLPSGTFLQSIGACGTLFLSRLTPDGHTTRVKIPGVSDSVRVDGVSGDKLVLTAKAGCGPGTSLLAYDPAASTFTVLLGPVVNGGSVTEALVYPGRE